MDLISLILLTHENNEIKSQTKNLWFYSIQNLHATSLSAHVNGVLVFGLSVAI